MSDNVTQFPIEPPPKLLVGPFEEYRVVVDGRVIPRLTGHYEGDKIALVLDGRFSHSFSQGDAYSAAWLIANALAIGAGYSHLGAESKEHPFAPKAMQVDTIA
jgi:hypothetical protein